MAAVLSLALMGGAFAYFTDVETSTGNVMSAGTLDIQIANPGGTYGDTVVTGTFNSPAGLAPGDSFTAGPVFLKNAGSIDIHRIYARFGGLSEVTGAETDAETAAEAGTQTNNI
jgi:predicted ribosomally synthesized peptide with SipW-like signal peptide